MTIILKVYFFLRALPPLPFKTFNSVEEWTPLGSRIDSVGQYFKYLHTPQTSCKKLARMGGTLDCVTKAMDGHKVSLHVVMEQLVHSSLF